MVNLVEIMAEFHACLAEAQAHRRLPAYIDDCMLEMEEQDNALYQLLQHFLAQVKENCNPDVAGHLLFCLAYTIHKAHKNGQTDQTPKAYE